MENYLSRFDDKNINVVLIKDGPLLSDGDTMLEACMNEYMSTGTKPCQISFQMDDATRTLQSQAFDNLAEQFNFVTSIDYLPELYVNGSFSPISDDGEYLMFDRHHLTEKASLLLEDFFQEHIIHSSVNE
jgi:hypothetical protein